METHTYSLNVLFYYCFQGKGKFIQHPFPRYVSLFQHGFPGMFFISTWLPRYISLYQYGSTRSSNEKFYNSVARGYRVNKFISKFDSYQDLIQNTKTASDIKEKGHFFRKKVLEISPPLLQAFFKTFYHKLIFFIDLAVSENRRHFLSILGPCQDQSHAEFVQSQHQHTTTT